MTPAACRLARGLVGLFLLTACTSARHVNLQENVRKAAKVPVTEVPGGLARAMEQLARAGGLDPSRLYFAMSATDTLNAAAYCRGHFVITRGAINTKDACFVIGLAAHEIGHDVLQHAESRATTGDIVNVVSVILGTAAGAFVPGAGYAVSGAATLGLRAYSRGQEDEADRRATELLRAAGYPDWYLRYALMRLRVENDSAPGGWLSTHPALEERIAAQPPMEEAEVRRRCGAIVFEPPKPPPWCRGPGQSYDRATGWCTNQ